MAENSVRTLENAVSHKSSLTIIEQTIFDQAVLDPLLLAISTAFDECSVALCSAEVRDMQLSSRPRRHADDVLSMIENLLVKHNLTLASVSAIAMISGPGSFTGLRIGAAVTQGLAFGLNLPVVCVSALAIMALDSLLKNNQQLTQHHLLIAVCVHARESEFYFAVYSADETGMPVVKLPDRTLEASQFAALLDQLSSTTADHNKAITWIGSGSGWLHPLLKDCVSIFNEIHSNPSCQALLLADLARNQLQHGRALSAEQALPVYLNDDLHYATV